MKQMEIFMVPALLSALLLAGCGSSSETYTDTTASFYSNDSIGLEKVAEDYSYSVDDYDYEYESAEESSVNLEGYDLGRKIVYTSYINLESKKFDEDVAAIKEMVLSSGGYFESTSTYGSVENGSRSSDFTARIPADSYDDFMSSVGDVGSVTYKSESVDDITSSYVDVQARLSSLNTKLARLKELEEAADNVTDLLEIEDRINEVQYQIENYTAQMRVYDDMVDYSTVHISIAEVATYTEVKADSAFNRFAEAFSDSWLNFVSFLQGAVIWVIYLVPYLLVVAIVALAIFLIQRRGKKNKVKKALEKKDN